MMRLSRDRPLMVTGQVAAREDAEGQVAADVTAPVAGIFSRGDLLTCPFTSRKISFTGIC